MKTKQIVILIGLLIIVIIGSLVNKNYNDKKIFEAKQNLLLEEIEKNRISEKEKQILEFKKQSDKNKMEIDILNDKIFQFNLTLSEKEFMQECIKIQIDRAFEWKDVENSYCDEKLLDNRAKTSKIAPVSNSSIKKDIVYQKSNFKIEKSTLFMCLEVKNTFWLKADENRCATMMTLVKFLETENWTTWIWPKYNNMYWIKKPTDKKWLLWDWKVMSENNIKFQTKEMSSYAFAYYYMNYHNHRNFDNFVKRWVAWDNENYKYALEKNYNWIYSEYENL